MPRLPSETVPISGIHRQSATTDESVKTPMSRSIPNPLKFFIWFYLALGGLSLAIAILDPSNDPLAAIFLILLAMPWTLILTSLNDALGWESVTFNYGFLSVGIGINAAILYGIGVLIMKGRG